MTQINQPGAGPETSGPIVVPPESVEAEALAALKAATEDDRPPVPRSYVVLLILALFGTNLAFTTPLVLSLAIGWIVSTLGWGQIFGGLQNSQADRLPASQRGKVAGLTGMAGMMAPVIGSVAGSALSSSPYLLFLVPGLIGAVLVVLFLLFVQEPDSRDLILEEKLSARGLFSKYLYNPRSYPDFSWNF